MAFNKRSRDMLDAVHPDLAKVMTRAEELSPIKFVVTEGMRTPQRQKIMVAKGLSKTFQSRHLTGHAVDVAATIENKITWAIPAYATIADAVFKASSELKIPIRWGGDWNGNGNMKDETFVDAVHFELPKAKYPGDASKRVTSPTSRFEIAARKALAIGDRGDAVKALQTALGIVSDGLFGNNTRKAVAEFQTRSGLAVTGVADDRTLKALKI